MNEELIQVAQKMVKRWKGTDTYHQAAEIISMLIDELESSKKYAFWAEYGGDDEGFHHCSNCKKAAFNYDDGDDTIEVLTDFCPHCGRPMKSSHE